MVLVLFKNMAKNGVHFWANWADIFMGSLETIIYRLVVRNPSDAYF